MNTLSSPRILAHFVPGRALRLETDAAQSKGLGMALWQEQGDRTWKLLQCGSRFLTDAESRYSATEIEMLAVVWAVKKAKLFLLGSSFEVVVDHKPLIPIINSKFLDEIESPRIRNMKEKLAMYRMTAVWRKGADHKIAIFSRVIRWRPPKAATWTTLTKEIRFIGSCRSCPIVTTNMATESWKTKPG